MRQMKDSGIEWIGEIPAEWEVRKLGKVSKICTGQTLPKDGNVNYYSDRGVMWVKPDNLQGLVSITETTEYFNDAAIDKVIIVDAMTPLVCCIGSIGKLGFSNERVTFNQQINAIIFTESVHKKFGLYLLVSQEPQHWYYSNGNVIKILNSSNQKNIIVPLPSLPEQQRIAAYLDAKCGEIDKVMSKTRESIAEYKKLKQSIITEAVTKGVDGERPMKDSGIEWIGQIPAEWEVLMAFQLFDEIGTLNVNLQEKNLLSLSYGKIIRKDIDTKSGLLPESFETYNIVESNDIVLRLTDLQNDHRSLRVGISGERGIVTSAYVSLRSKSNNLPRYLYYYLHSFDIAKGFYGMGAGVRQGLNWNGLKHLKITVPSLSEQQRIVAYLDKKCSEIDNLIARKEQLLTELEKYKKFLIYECVTGKREVG